MKALNRTFSKVLAGLFLSSLALSASAQDAPAASSTKGEFSVGADLVSSYVWRGFDQGATGPSIQPTVEFTYGSLSIGAWGSTNFAGTSKECDFYVGYAVSDAFSVTITDYNWAIANNYFEYDNDLTSHVYELGLAYSGEKFSASVNTMFYGADKAVDGADLKNAYTTYFELGYALTDNTSLAVGGLLVNEDAVGINAYGVAQDGVNICNISLTTSKDIKITDSFTLPLSGSVILNPMSEDVNFVVTASF